jgi:hypothetical protein
LLKNIPKGGTGCEIGVFVGDNAQFLRDELKPNKLFLVDPWFLESWDEVLSGKHYSIGLPLLPEAVDGYRTHLKLLDPEYDGGNPAPVFEKLYRSVTARFAGDNHVEIVRKKSLDAVGQFADRSFDFIYVDGDHSFDAVYNDLIAYERKLKPGGVLIGNDYLCSSKPIHNHYGVVAAVTHFCKVKGYRIIALTYGEYADFVLAKSESDYVRSFLQGVIRSGVPLFGIPTSNLANYQNGYVVDSATQTERFIPMF